jgi:hypothetical protein
VNAGELGSLVAAPPLDKRTLDGHDASMVPLFGDRSDSRTSDTAEE